VKDLCEDGSGTLISGGDAGDWGQVDEESPESEY
jgi:hypothetical protein